MVFPMCHTLLVYPCRHFVVLLIGSTNHPRAEHQLETAYNQHPTVEESHSQRAHHVPCGATRAIAHEASWNELRYGRSCAYGPYLFCSGT